MPGNPAADRPSPSATARWSSPFPTTRWTLLGEVRPGVSTRRRKPALEELARTYWKPVHAYIRARWARTDEDALDLTQDFFVWMLQRDIPGRADRRRGMFRALI
jgi:hypothetical protein